MLKERKISLGRDCKFDAKKKKTDELAAQASVHRA